MADLALQGHMPMGLLAEAIHHGQPQAYALANGFGAEKRFEGVLQRALRHTLAVIDDAQAQVFTTVQGAPRELLVLDPLVARLDA
ncbi:hypothetical protein D3C80_1558760 [compost metagenome]